MKLEEMYQYCEANRDADRFCSLCSSCSGPSRSNMAEDFPFPAGKLVYRGGSYGSCYFEVDKEQED